MAMLMLNNSILSMSTKTRKVGKSTLLSKYVAKSFRESLAGALKSSHLLPFCKLACKFSRLRSPSQLQWNNQLKPLYSALTSGTGLSTKQNDLESSTMMTLRQSFTPAMSKKAPCTQFNPIKSVVDANHEGSQSLGDVGVNWLKDALS
jgi:hypothetical protein